MLNWLIRRLPQGKIGQADDAEPKMGVDFRLPVHIVAEGAELRIEDGLLQVDAAAESRSLRLDEISLVALHGSVSITTPCLTTLAQAGVTVLFHSQNGYYRAQVSDLSANHSSVRRAHYLAAADPKAVLEIARELVQAKILNAHHLMRRRFGASAGVVRQLAREAKNARRARSLESLRSVESAAAASYWGAWPELLRAEGDLFVFDGRSRRPPRDAVNALLSYLYAVACGSCAAAALGAGLDPRIGFLHAERPGRPALALDMVEPLRPAVIDTAVITAINKGQFGPDDFEMQPDGSVRLSDAGRRLALVVLERRLSTIFDYDGVELTWRAAISRHAQLLSARLRGERRDAPPPRIR